MCNNIVKYHCILSALLVLACACSSRKQGNTTGSVPDDNTGISLSEAQIQLANIVMAESRKGTIGMDLFLTGVLKINEQTAVTVSSRTAGRVEKLYFKNTGESVKKGDKLYDFYSDDLIKAQREYFSLQSNNWNFSGRYEPSLELENKLLIMGMIPEQIQELGENGKILFRVTIYSTCKGKIRSVNVGEGQYVSPGDVLYELAEDNTLWLEAQVYPDDIQLLKTGMPATAIVPLVGNVPLQCRINFINPSFEQGKNVMLARAEIDNPDHTLHPGMLAILKIRTNPVSGIIIPASAVISGSDGDIVWVRDETGAFLEKKVITGIQSGDSVLVLSGLDLSDKVVSSGAYLLNSEQTLKHGTDSKVLNNPNKSHPELSQE